MKVEVFYQYQGEGLTPQWMLIRFQSGEFDWSKNFLYLPINIPFESKENEFLNEEMSLTVTIVDLVMHPKREGYFGINIQNLRTKYGYANLDEVDQFVIWMDDLEELLAMDRNKLFAYR